MKGVVNKALVLTALAIQLRSPHTVLREDRGISDYADGGL
jgi:hypothetical protein